MIPTTVTFYGDVGFDRSYNNVIDFSTPTKRNAYFNSKIVKQINNCAYNKPIDTLQIECDYTEALQFTYCSFVIGSANDNKKTIYAWVDDVAVVTDQPVNGTYKQILSVNISVDPWQTFLFDYTLGESFVAREHVDRFKVNSDGTLGWTLSNKTDKGNVGLEKRKTKLSSFKTEHRFHNFLWNQSNPGYNDRKLNWMAIQYADTTEENEINKVTAIHIALVPFCDKSRAICSEQLTADTFSRTLPNTAVFNDTFLELLGIDPEKVASVSYIPFDCYNYNGIKHITYTVPITEETITIYASDITLKFSGFEFKRSSAGFNPWDGLSGFFGYFEKTYKEDDVYELPLIFSQQMVITNTGLVAPSEGDVYSPNHEPQLYKQPYRYISIVDESGVERGILPDIMANISNQTYTLNFYLIMDTVDVRLRIVPVLPNGIETDNTYWLEYPLTDIDVLSSHWFSYLVQQRQADRDMIQSQLNQQLIAGAIGSVAGATSGNAGMNAWKGEVASRGNFQPTIGIGQAAGVAGLVGLGAGAISAVGNYLSNTYYAFEQQSIRESAIKRKANNVIASGTFKGIIKDELSIYLMECDETTFNIKSKEFHKYGYSVFTYETPNTKSRKFFNYIATDIVKIEGSLNNNIKIALSDIYNNGVTIWHGDNIDELSGIGDYSKENIEVSLLEVNNG